jgi:hypothetical protein
MENNMMDHGDSSGIFRAGNITVMEYEWNFGMYIQQTKSLDNIMTI